MGNSQAVLLYVRLGSIQIYFQQEQTQLFPNNRLGGNFRWKGLSNEIVPKKFTANEMQ
jgi:hypothetical protein